MSERVFEVLGLGYRMDIPDRATSIEVGPVQRSRGEYHGDLIVRSAWPGARTYEGVLWTGWFNLSSDRTRTSLGKHLTVRSPAATPAEALDWMGFVDEFCKRVLDAEREGAPFVDVGERPEQVPPKPLVTPILLQRKPTILFGDGGVGKSFMAVAMALSVRTGRVIIPGFNPLVQGQAVYLDWETDDDDVDHRTQMVCEGAGMAKVSFKYRFCSRPLKDMVEQVVKVVKDTGAVLLVIDSLGAAMGAGGEGDPAETTHRFFDALRLIDTAALIIDHVPKPPPGTSVAALKPYGSTFKVNRARQTWEIRQATTTADNDVHIALYNQKSNDGPRHAAMGLAVRFENDVVRWINEEIDDPDLTASLPLADRIARVLADEEGLDMAGIAERVGSTRGAVASALHRNTNRFFAAERGRWALVAV